jgi:hypothetical protein
VPGVRSQASTRSRREYAALRPYGGTWFQPAFAAPVAASKPANTNRNAAPTAKWRRRKREDAAIVAVGAVALTRATRNGLPVSLLAPSALRYAAVMVPAEKGQAPRRRLCSPLLTSLTGSASLPFTTRLRLTGHQLTLVPGQPPA